MVLLTYLFKTWIFIILCFWVFYCDSKNYCGAKFCNNTKEHILCKFQSPGPASACINYKQLFTTGQEKKDLLHKINSRRDKVASGEIRSLPAAENMMKLRWNKDLEISAQRWADQCVKSGLYDGTDSCRDLEFMPVGQNIATIYGEAPGLRATSMIDLWFMELLNMNASILSHYIPSSITGMQHYDYFTQLVWGGTTQVGCGGVKFKEIDMESGSLQNRTVSRLVCNFAPAGNQFDKSVYNFGSPSTRCDFGRNCDSEYTYLCSASRLTSTVNEILNYDDNTKNPQNVVNNVNFDTISNVQDWSKNANINSDIEQTLPTTNVVESIDTQFDFFSDLFDITKPSLLQTERSTTKCKEVLAVDEFIELLKSRINNDHILRDFLQSTTRSNPEPVLSDGTVAAIIKQLYSKKESPTTSKLIESESLNSTLLVDLVEAVIFRHSDKYTSTEDTKLLTPIVSQVRPVKIQAELGEVKSNNEFTGHYFFPEEEDQTEKETADLYDEIIPTSEISLEIEEFKRHRTKDFLEEILESDFITDGTMRDNILSTINNPNDGP
ncbi:peptidase inhibitor 16-like [Vanessa cardui]|uniref:peptidase inhibitor 16-like n=1 Tax=Vanessa cardui TaxID=171605 RepID=UPI001F133B61|nr:peptidase inhibitor 16-like [Vanessa cardui]